MSGARLVRDALKRVARPLARRAFPGEAPSLGPGRLVRDVPGSLLLDDAPLEPLLHRFGSPLFVVDGARLAANAARFTVRPEGALRPLEVFCSYKTNPVPGVLQALHGAGLGAEVVSPYELWLALRLGVAPEAIVYNGPAKTDASLDDAVARGVQLVNVNARPELARLAAAARRVGRRARAGIRVVVPGTWGGQFGERIDTGAALAAFEEARALPELDVVAVHAHYNGELSTAAELDGFLSGVLAFADVLRARLGLEPEVLDLGGNLACPTVSRPSPRARRLAAALGVELPPRAPGAVLTVEEYLARIARRVGAHYRAAGRPVPRIFLEPGRALTGDAQHLLCRVVEVRDPDADGLGWAVLDAGIQVAEALRSEQHRIVPLVEAPGAPRLRYRLTGPSCTQGDLLHPGAALPPLARGDGLAILDTGAYFVPFATQFSFPRPAVVLVEDGEARVLREAERFEDLVARDVTLAPGADRGAARAG